MQRIGPMLRQISTIQMIGMVLIVLAWTFRGFVENFLVAIGVVLLLFGQKGGLKERIRLVPAVLAFLIAEAIGILFFGLRRNP